MKTQNEIDTIMLAWTTAFAQAAAMEGWDLFTATEGSQVQVQRFDEIDAVPEGGTYLPSDAVAMMMVRTGTGAHHSAARKILYDHFPDEWVLVEQATKNVISRIMLAEAVKAKLAYWDAFRMLETHLTGEDFSDKANDEVHEFIEMIAAGAPEGDVPLEQLIEEEHVTELLKLVKDNS